MTDEETLIVGCRIFDEIDTILEDHGMMLAGTKIASVAPMIEFEGYQGVTLDCSGGFILPGLIDCHVHLCLGGEPDPQLALDNLRPAQLAIRALGHAQAALKGGFTGLRDCGGKDYLEFAVRDACNSGSQCGPTIRAAGRMICMTGGHGNRFARVADGVDEVVKAVREQIHAGSDLIKLMATGGVMTPRVDPNDAHFSAEEMAAGIAEGHRFHRPCASHAQGEQGILNSIIGGIDSIEHGFCLSKACIEMMVEHGTFLVPTLSALRNIINNAESGIPSYAVEKARRWEEVHIKSVKRFYSAGGKIALGTDAGTPFNRHGANAQELRYMVDSIGMKPKDALIAATRNGCELMRLAGRGAVANGTTADLLIVRDNPLTDIEMVADTRNHLMLVKDGIVMKDGRPAAARPRSASDNRQ